MARICAGVAEHDTVIAYKLGAGGASERQVQPVVDRLRLAKAVGTCVDRADRAFFIGVGCLAVVT